MTGPHQYPESVPPQSYPEPQLYPEQVPSAYPGPLPPPVDYPRRRWPKFVTAGLVAAALIAAVTTVVVARPGRPAEVGVVSNDRAQAAIQQYLSALSDGDIETVARHASCGLYDAVKDRRADLAVAKLAGDTFRKQFGHAEVTSIDKIVPWSGTQAQVLFTMRVTPNTAPGARRSSPPEEDEQGVAQLLVQGKDVSVCSYILRTGGQF